VTPAFPALLTVPETAALLRLTPKAVYTLIGSAQLPGVIRLGRRVRVDRAALVSWLEASRAPSPREGERR
jgi:excisionase family DNA binding protein